MNFPDSAHGTPSMDDTSAKMKVLDDDPEEKDYKFDFDLRQIDDLLPDEDEFFAGITDEIEPVGKTNNTEELEEFDVFGSGGGMELDLDPLESVTASFANSSIADGARGNGISPYGVPSAVGTVAGEHPYGEHPSRTLFVRNINSNVEDSELRTLFEVLKYLNGSRCSMTYVVYANPVSFLIHAIVSHTESSHLCCMGLMMFIIAISAIWGYQNPLHCNKAQGFCNDILF